MAGLIALKDKFDIAFGNDADYDRHGIVTRSSGLLSPNHYLSVAIDYLFQNRPGWRADAAIGKTLVSSAMIDRVAGALGRTLAEQPDGPVCDLFMLFGPEVTWEADPPLPVRWVHQMAGLTSPKPARGAAFDGEIRALFETLR